MKFSSVFRGHLELQHWNRHSSSSAPGMCTVTIQHTRHGQYLVYSRKGMHRTLLRTRHSLDPSKFRPGLSTNIHIYIIILINDILITRQSQYLATLTLSSGPSMCIPSIQQTRNFNYLAHPDFSESGKLQNRHASVVSSSAPVPSM